MMMIEKAHQTQQNAAAPFATVLLPQVGVDPDELLVSSSNEDRSPQKPHFDSSSSDPVLLLRVWRK
jgi:hypothetical protein